MAQSSKSGSDTPFSLSSHQKNDIFISYSRKDKDFVQQLDTNLRRTGRDPWVDWEDIRQGEDWWQSIQRGIEGADSVVFVISPDSVMSAVCRDEIDYATKLNKRFLPLLWREGFDMAHVHRSISQHNWIFARATDDGHAAFQELLAALDTDLDYVRSHTRLLMRSLEWHNQGKNSSYLLRGIDLTGAQQWLNQSVSKQPQPTGAQVAYINASLDATAAALKARQRAKRLVVLTTVIANLVFVATGLSVIYWQVNTIAQRQVKETMTETLNGAIAGIDGDDFAKLAQVGPQPNQAEPLGNLLYQEHQDWLQTVHQIAPTALPITYIREANGKIVTIGDICRVILDPATHPYRMMVPDAEMIPARLEGFERISVNLTPFKDQFGKSWVSVYGPIRNEAGMVVGQLGLAYDSTYWTNLEQRIRQMMIWVCLAALIWLVISSGLILRATRPPQER
jgi:hypothetical protein